MVRKWKGKEWIKESKSLVTKHLQRGFQVSTRAYNILYYYYFYKLIQFIMITFYAFLHLVLCIDTYSDRGCDT